MDPGAAWRAPPGGATNRFSGFWALTRAGFRRYGTYGQASLAGIATNTVFALIRVAILLAVVRQTGQTAGYDSAAIVAYVWLSQGLYSVVLLWGDGELAHRVRSGDIVIDLSRPWDLQVAVFATDLGRAGFAAGGRLLPPVLIGSLLFDFRWPRHPGTYLVFALSVLLALVTSFAIRFALGLATFWLLGTRGVDALYGVVAGTLAGLTLPLDFFPAVVRDVLWATPFPAMLQGPLDVFLERGSVTATLLHQVVWAVALLLGGRWVLRRARLRFVAQGG